jgi:hypothetical protein
MKKRLPLYLLIAFIVANIIYMFLAPLMIMEKIKKDTTVHLETRTHKSADAD